MLLNVFDSGILSDKEPVDTVMLGICSTAVIDTASGNDHDITVLTDKEIVIDDFRQTAQGHYDRNMYTLIPGTVLYPDIQTGAVLLGCDLDIR